MDSDGGKRNRNESVKEIRIRQPDPEDPKPRDLFRSRQTPRHLSNNIARFAVRERIAGVQFVFRSDSCR